MTTFARLQGGVVLDPVKAESADAAQALFGEAGADWVFVAVPDGTSHGARDNGDGTYSNPGLTADPVTLSKVGFMDLAYPHLGADLMAGIARYGSVLMQAKASTSPVVVAAMERYEHASVFEREDVATFLDILVVDPSVDLTEAERDTIIGAWPVHEAA